MHLHARVDSRHRRAAQVEHPRCAGADQHQPARQCARGHAAFEQVGGRQVVERTARGSARAAVRHAHAAAHVHRNAQTLRTLGEFDGDQPTVAADRG